MSMVGWMYRVSRSPDFTDITLGRHLGTSTLILSSAALWCFWVARCARGASGRSSAQHLRLYRCITLVGSPHSRWRIRERCSNATFKKNKSPLSVKICVPSADFKLPASRLHMHFRSFVQLRAAFVFNVLFFFFLLNPGFQVTSFWAAHVF